MCVKYWFKKMSTGLMLLGIGFIGAILKYSNEVSGSIISREFLVLWSDCYEPFENSASWKQILETFSVTSEPTSCLLFIILCSVQRKAL